MATLGGLLEALDRTMPLGKAAGWDPVGIQVGDPALEVARIGVCHDVTDQVIDRALANRLDALVAYHPLLFRPTTRFVAGRGPSGRALRLAAAGIGLIVVHTGFDVAPGGAGDALAEAVGLSDVSGFGPLWGADSVKVVTFAPSAAVDAIATAMSAAGAGTIGRYSGCSFRVGGTGAFVAEAGSSPSVGVASSANLVEEERLEMVAPANRLDAVVASLVAAHPYEEPAYDVYDRRGDAGFVGRVGAFAGDLEALVARVADQVGGVTRLAGPEATAPMTVAVVPGSGSSFITAAGAAGATVLLTGDVSHHEARAAADVGLAIVDPGHAATEGPGLRKLYAAVADEVGEAVDLTEIDSDPWREPGGQR